MLSGCDPIFPVRKES